MIWLINLEQILNIPAGLSQVDHGFFSFSLIVSSSDASQSNHLSNHESVAYAADGYS